jgi:hypothetical protein
MESVGNYQGICPNCKSINLEDLDEGFADIETYCKKYSCYDCDSIIEEHYNLQYFASEILYKIIKTDETGIQSLF